MDQMSITRKATAVLKQGGTGKSGLTHFNLLDLFHLLWSNVKKDNGLKIKIVDKRK